MEMSHIAFLMTFSFIWYCSNFLHNITSLRSMTIEKKEKKKEKWSFNEFISYYLQEEGRLNQDMTEGAKFATTPKNKDKGIKRNNMKAVDKSLTQKKQQHEKKGCFFWNKE